MMIPSRLVKVVLNGAVEAKTIDDVARAAILSRLAILTATYPKKEEDSGQCSEAAGG